MRKPAGLKIGFGKKVFAAAGITALVLALLTVFFPKTFQTAGFYLQRGINGFSYYILGASPHFYHLEMEKNASDFRVRAGETLDVTYRDEFVVKSVASDDWSGKSLEPVLEGPGGKAGIIGVPFRGIDLVDKLLAGGVIPEGTQAAGVYQIAVYSTRDKIGVVPLRVMITPQDWLRFAKSRGNPGEQEAYLKKAAAQNREDAGVRKILAGIYLQQNRIGEAAKLYEEILRISPAILAMKELAAALHSSAGRPRHRSLSRLTEVRRRMPSPCHARAAYGRKTIWDKAADSYFGPSDDPDNHGCGFAASL